MARYTITSPEGASFAAGLLAAEAEVDSTVELTLDADQERAVIAAGWIDHAKKEVKG